MTYAIIRYHFFGGVEWVNFPLFFANKAISLSAVFFIAMSSLIGNAFKIYAGNHPKRLVLIKFCGLIGFSLAAIHAFMALLLFTPEYYPKLFGSDGRLNLIGCVHRDSLRLARQSSRRQWSQARASRCPQFLIP